MSTWHNGLFNSALAQNGGRFLFQLEGIPALAMDGREKNHEFLNCRDLLIILHLAIFPQKPVIPRRGGGDCSISDIAAG